MRTSHFLELALDRDVLGGMTSTHASLYLATRGDGYSLDIHQLGNWHWARTGKRLSRAELTAAWRAGDVMITPRGRFTVRRS